MGAPSETQRTESRKEATTATSVPTPAPTAVQNSALKPPDVLFSHIATETPALPVPPPLADRHDHVLYPRSGFVAHPQQLVHPKPFERSRTDPVPTDDAPNGSAHTTVPMSSWPQPPPPMPQSKLLAGSMPAVEQMIPGSTPSTNNYEGYGRGIPRDRSSYHPQSTPAPHFSGTAIRTSSGTVISPLFASVCVTFPATGAAANE
ncbi:hypothetical protein DFH11DRAFT_1142523 [Phellopilus nigrolimitatus]|nr:hypothetical protein DFH11DRAFT_1142523 [Phellopilus nigrolimitatus]